MLDIKYMSHHKVDHSHRNSDEGRIESVQKSSMTWDDVSWILDIIMSLPLGFDQVTVNSGDAKQDSHTDAVDQIKAEYVKVVKGNGDTDGTEKSSPESYPRFLRWNRREKFLAIFLTQCDSEYPWVMVGDTAFDVIGAKAHNIPAIGVAWGYGIVEEMRQAGAASIVYDTDELLRQLQK